MFKRSAEQHIIVEADRIASRKESFDALSWGRVVDIAKRLQTAPHEKERTELADELLAIAQANTSLINKLGMGTAVHVERYAQSSSEGTFSSEVVPAVFEDEGHSGVFAIREPFGVASTSLGHSPLPETGSPYSVIYPSQGSVPVVPDIVHDNSAFFAEPQPDVHDIIPRGEVLAQPVPDPVAPTPAVTETATKAAAPAAIEAPSPTSATNKKAGAAEATTPTKEESSPKVTSATPPKANPKPETIQKTEAVAAAKSNSKPEPSAKDFKPSPALRREANRTAPKKDGLLKESLARFRNIYESRDGSLCIFEDGEGHIVAVNASHLA